jgi:hypothetical protein
LRGQHRFVAEILVHFTISGEKDQKEPNGVTATMIAVELQTKVQKLTSRSFSVSGENLTSIRNSIARQRPGVPRRPLDTVANLRFA